MTEQNVEPLDLSIANGGHKIFTRLPGEWEGITHTWFEDEEPVSSSPTRGRVTSLLGGRFVQFDYQSSIEGNTFLGSFLMGYNLDQKRYEAAWIDSFHMSTGIMFSVGEGTAQGFSVLGSYPAGDGTHWGWRTVFEVNDQDQFIWKAFNITPDGQEYRALETVFTKAAA